MKLSTRFELDAQTPWVARHNDEVREVWDSYRADRPLPVPVLFTAAVKEFGRYR